MFGQCLLLGTGISGISTGAYAAFTQDKYDPRDRKNEYIYIFCIILVVSFIMLFIFGGNSESLVSTNINSLSNGNSPIMTSGKPPF
jgi:hypothetical protein